MQWKISIHPLVIKEDFKQISVHAQKLIVRAIRKKLALEPQKFGKPLSGNLKGYWRLRTGKYRIIYRIRKDRIEVLIIKVGIRKDAIVYKKVFARLNKLGN